jgi:hypothetical protein
MLRMTSMKPLLGAGTLLVLKSPASANLQRLLNLDQQGV